MGKCSIIYADPPWSYDDKALSRGGAERHYRTMPLQDIAALPVREVAATDSLLFMWGAWPKLFEAQTVMEGWGGGSPLRGCPRCDGEMIASKALDDIPIGVPDFAGGDVCTVSASGRARLIDCQKCS